MATELKGLTMLGKFYVTGFSSRFGNWMCEVVEAQTMESAKQKFQFKYPNLRQLKAYALRNPGY